MSLFDKKTNGNKETIHIISPNINPLRVPYFDAIQDCNGINIAADMSVIANVTPIKNESWVLPRTKTENNGNPVNKIFRQYQMSILPKVNFKKVLFEKVIFKDLKKLGLLAWSIAVSSFSKENK